MIGGNEVRRVVSPLAFLRVKMKAPTARMKAIMAKAPMAKAPMAKAPMAKAPMAEAPRPKRQRREI